jgi:hypothetical protein
MQQALKYEQQDETVRQLEHEFSGAAAEPTVAKQMNADKVGSWCSCISSMNMQIHAG